MEMKAYACPRCLTMSSTTADGDGGPHTCIPSPLIRDLESRIDALVGYVQHLDGCRHREAWGCTCGLDRILSRPVDG